MTTKRSQACGMKSWVFGHARPHADMIFLDFEKSKGLQSALCFKNVRACLPLGQKTRNANAIARDSCCLKVFPLHAHFRFQTTDYLVEPF